MTTVRYAIAWENEDESDRGEGPPKYVTRTEAVNIVNRLNRKHFGTTHYWVKQIALNKPLEEILTSSIFETANEEEE